MLLSKEKIYLLLCDLESCGSDLFCEIICLNEINKAVENFLISSDNIFFSKIF